MNYHLAVDIGASSGRHILGWIEDGQIKLQEMYRFDNNATERGGHLCWDTEAQLAHITAGMRACKEAGKIPTTMGIDTWGVDIVLLDKDDNVVGDTVAYRDSRTEGMVEAVEAIVPYDEIYAITGTQQMQINTIYHLMALKRSGELDKADSLLMIPDYLHFLLTGQKNQEYTEVSTSALMNAREKKWDDTLIETLGFPKRLFKPLAMPGTVVGTLRPAVRDAVGFDCTVVLPASHDTGSAYLAVPADHDRSVYISCGTWSLMGVENPEPVLTEAAREANFTNEGGYDGSTRFLKNIIGLWLIQETRRQYRREGSEYSYNQLEKLALAAEPFRFFIDPDDQAFVPPGDLPGRIRAYCERTGQGTPQTVGEIMRCIYESLAMKYRMVFRQVGRCTGKEYISINMVGGGIKDNLLCDMAAASTGVPIHAGPSEATALGNIAMQMMHTGDLADVPQARAAIRQSFAPITYEPRDTAAWDAAYERFKQVIGK